MSIKKRLQALESRLHAVTESVQPSLPTRTPEETVSIIQQLVGLGAFPEYPDESFIEQRLESY